VEQYESLQNTAECKQLSLLDGECVPDALLRQIQRLIEPASFPVKDGQPTSDVVELVAIAKRSMDLQCFLCRIKRLRPPAQLPL
jgi:hypothetical protein